MNLNSPDLQAELFRIAGTLSRCSGFFKLDNHPRVKRSALLAALEHQDTVIGDLAYQLGQLARRLTPPPPKLPLQIVFPGEPEAIAQVVAWGAQFGYGNLIQHLKEAWMHSLMEKWGFDEPAAARAAGITKLDNQDPDQPSSPQPGTTP